MNSPMRLVNLIIYASDDGRDNWEPVKPVDVPLWVRSPDVLAALESGQECLNSAEGPAQARWYRALRADDLPTRMVQ